MRYLFIVVFFVLTVTVLNTAWGFCPQDSVDRGNCDTMYIEPWALDIADTAWARTGEHFVRVPIYITDDIYVDYDSIRAFVIPLCYYHSNPSKYCSVSTYWNKTLWSDGNLYRSIFRHLPTYDNPQVHNWMMDLFDVGEGQDWDFITLDLDGTSHFWLSLIANGAEDVKFSAGSKILLATMTMRLEDTMHICIDTCFWPPNSRLAFVIPDQYGFAVPKIPRSGTGTSIFQVCFPGISQTPHVVSISPFQNQLNVPVDTNLSVTFDMDMDPTTFNDSTFVVNAWSTGLHKGAIIYDSPTRTATLNPTKDFDQGEIVTVALTTGIKSSVGTPMESSYVWSFTTSVDDGAACFSPPFNYGAGDCLFSVYCADLDGDGDMDLAIANYYSNDVSILKNNGDGIFQTAVNYGVGDSPSSVFCTDLDSDKDLDLVVANGDNISILKNNGDGTFQDAVNYQAGALPYSVFCADLDGDGDMDLTAANIGSNNVSVFKNQGDGTFQAAVNYGVGDFPSSVFCADLDGDGDLDLAAANSGSNIISVLKNQGDGTFQDAVNYQAGALPYSVFCADLDGDGDLDLAVSIGGSNSVSILRNNGDGSFQAAVNYRVGNVPSSVFCADLDGDGDMDLAIANYYSNDVSILKNNGDGIFQAAINHKSGIRPRSVFCADLDGDGDLDIAVANDSSSNVSLLLNIRRGDCTGDEVVDVGDVVFLINYLFKSGTAPKPLAVGDVNCDGVADVGDVVYLINYLFKGGPAPCC